MTARVKKLLGFPYPLEYEVGYNQNLMKTMHKPLLVAVVATLLFVAWLVSVCVFWPASIAPAQYIQGLTIIHFVFMVFTMLVLLVVVSLRRQLFQHPRLHVALCNFYAVGVCAWAAVLSAYANYSAAVYTAFIFVTLCVSMISLFKPWVALVVYTLNYALYYALLHAFWPQAAEAYLTQLFSTALASIVGTIISIAFYRFRTRTYYSQQIITEQLGEINKINRQLQQLIHIDNLTGLYNRRFYEEALPGEMEKGGVRGCLCGMMFDVDFFKKFNDQYGHPEGDVCLRRVASAIQSGLPAGRAFAVRYGGEEFFVLCEVADAREAMEIADAMRRTVENAFVPNGASPFGRVTMSGGVALCEKGRPCALQELTKWADAALYRAKREGRNRVCAEAAAGA